MRILSHVLPESVMGDLTEEYALRLQTSSASAARRWYLRQVCASVPPLLWSAIRRLEWLETLGWALMAYLAVGLVQVIVNGLIVPVHPLNIVVTFPMVILIGYGAAHLRRRAPFVLAALMLLAVTIMTLTANENVPLWYRIVYFFAGPAAALTGGALHARRRRSFV